jgi:uncharacterized delta-60 repeat protein
MFTPFAFIQPITTATPITPITSTQYVLIGGQFTTYNSPVVDRIAKIDSTGNLDSSFNMGVGFGSGIPYFFIKQPDGKYLAGGFNITSYSGSSNNRVVRINQNGTKDTTFVLGTGFDNSPYDAASYSDNSNIIVGNFLTYSGSTANGMVKVTPLGNRDTTFDMGFGFANSGIGPARVVALQSDGKAIIGVQSSQYSSSNNSITRTDLSGSYNAGPGTTFNYGIGMGINNGVYTAVTQSDGKIILGGNFTTYSGSSTNTTRIVRLNPNGTQDTSFVTGGGFNNQVNALQIQSDGKIIAIGNFTSYNAFSINRIVRINTDGTRDTTFNVGTGFNVAMNNLIIQPDGKILVGGTGIIYSGSTINSLTRLNTDGTIDTTFNTGTGLNGTVNGLVLQSDGKIVIGGSFTTYSGSGNLRIVRINSDGTKDTTFNMGTGFNNISYGVALEPITNKIIVAGIFTTYSGSSTNTTRIIRLNPNGTQDTSFVTGAGLSGFSAIPSHLSVESDGKIYVGNGFTTYSGSTVNNFVRINPSGTLDTSFSGQILSPTNRVGFNTTVRSLFISSSNIYIFGDFNGYKPNAGGLIRLNTDGTQDMTFYTGNNIATGGTPNNLLVQTDGKILVIGASIGNYSGSITNANIFRLNSNGTIDTTFNVGTGPNGAIISAATESSGKIVLVGGFTTYSGSSVNRIVRITDSGSRDTSFNIGTGFDTFTTSVKNGQVIVSPDNSVYVAGDFTTYSGSTNANRIVKIQPSGAIDTSFVTATSSFNNTALGFNNATTVLVQSGSSVLIGGQFTSYKAPVINRGAMIDSTGAISSSFNIGTTGFVGGNVLTWATQSDGKILAGGGFTSYSGSSVNRIIRLNTNGTRDTTFNVGSGANGNINDIRVQADGKIIIMGILNAYSGSAVASNMTRLNTNGTIDTTYNLGSGFAFSQNVLHSALQADQKLIAVGPFTSFSGSTTNRIVRINTNGTRDTTFNIGAGFNGDVLAVIIQPDGKIITTGNFTSYSGSAINRIVRINTDGTRDTTFNVGTGFTVSSGISLALQSDGKIICANLNQQYSGSTNRYIIRINTDGTLDNTFNANANASLSSTSGTQNSLAIGSDGKIYWGSSFSTFSGSFAPNRIVRLNTNGSVDETFNQAFPNFVNNTGKGADSTVNAVLSI